VHFVGSIFNNYITMHRMKM